jgi:cytoskeletal protein RodZ
MPDSDPRDPHDPRDPRDTGWGTPWRLKGGFTPDDDPAADRARRRPPPAGPPAEPPFEPGGPSASLDAMPGPPPEPPPGPPGETAPGDASRERSRPSTRSFSVRAFRDRGSHRAPTSAEAPAVSLGDLLLTARERKGVDLYRAERDTKIRARYLAALERGDYAELPGSVYTKGFLRNYASYLGLDPDVALAQYHREHAAARTERVAIVPRSLEAPKSGFTLTPGLAVGAVLVIVVLAFAGFIVLQLFRFSRPPTLVITEPPTLVAELPGLDRTVIEGTSDPGATITIRGPTGQPLRVSADSEGDWQKEVALNKGRNDFTIVATDPVTAKDSPPVNLIITVPIPVSQAPTLSVTSPNKDAEFENGAVPIQGTTSGASVTVSARYVGPAVTPAPGSTPPEAPAQPRTKKIAVEQDGSFAGSYALAPGRWTMTIRAVGDEEKTTTETRSITVSYTGVSLVVDIKGPKVKIRVWRDGKLDPEFGEEGQTLPAGTTLELTAKKSVEVWTESAGETSFTVNGEPVGTLGKADEAGSWLFAPPAAPKKTNRK